MTYKIHALLNEYSHLSNPSKLKKYEEEKKKDHELQNPLFLL